ncbi:MAG: hypothetical protein ABIL09_24695, partial [Gemmatimonadota bacterium]
MNAAFLQRLRVPHVFVLLLGVILACSLLSYLIPAGQYQRESRTYGQLSRTVVVPGSFQPVPRHLSLRAAVIGEPVPGHASPVSLVGFLSAVPRGLAQAADIVFLIFILGGVFGIVQ